MELKTATAAFIHTKHMFLHKKQLLLIITTRLPPQGDGIMHWRLLSVCPSVCYVPDPKSRMEGCSKLKIGRKKAHDTRDPWPHLELERSNTCVGGGNFDAAQLECFTATLTSNGQLVYYDLQAERLYGGCSSHHWQGHIAAAPRQAAQLVIILTIFVQYKCVSSSHLTFRHGMV